MTKVKKKVEVMKMLKSAVVAQSISLVLGRWRKGVHQFQARLGYIYL